jgi:hypothetical protein
MVQKPRRFVLQALDPEHGSPVLEALFWVANFDELRALLGPCTDDDPELIGSYNLDTSDLVELSRLFGVVFDSGGRETQLCRWHSLRNVPYLVHTGYELPLMLEGRKPFSYFVQEYPPHQHFREEYFEPYVSKRVLRREVELEPFAAPIHGKSGQVFEGIRTVFYALKGEEWRIPAWKLIRTVAQKSGWNAQFERLEGTLLGYEDWQNDWWIARRWKDEAKNP